MVKGIRVGETLITARAGNYLQQCEVSVIATNFLFQEPSIAFNMSMDSIKRYEKRVLFLENNDDLVYEDENDAVRMVIYSFVNNRYLASGIILKPDVENEVVLDFLNQRYKPAPHLSSTSFNKEGVIATFLEDRPPGKRVIYQKK